MLKNDHRIVFITTLYGGTKRIIQEKEGTYMIGEDIPAGTYDFFVVYGNGGLWKKACYDSKDKAIDGTYDSYWIGLKDDYEKRELIHIKCDAGETIKIEGNVILKIARSEKVKIEL